MTVWSARLIMSTHVLKERRDGENSRGSRVGRRRGDDTNVQPRHNSRCVNE